MKNQINRTGMKNQINRMGVKLAPQMLWKEERWIGLLLSYLVTITLFIYYLLLLSWYDLLRLLVLLSYDAFYFNFYGFYCFLFTKNHTLQPVNGKGIEEVFWDERIAKVSRLFNNILPAVIFRLTQCVSRVDKLSNRTEFACYIVWGDILYLQFFRSHIRYFWHIF